MRAITNAMGKKSKKHKWTQRLAPKALRAKARRKLLRNKKKKDEMKEFLVEVRARADEGYSKRQLVSSLIPDIGTEIKVAESEVTEALRSSQVAFRGQGRGVINYFLVLCCVHVCYFSLSGATIL